MSVVDVIVPTYNGAELLRQCLAHLARSTFREFRLVVFDDGSTEDIESVVSEIFPAAHVIRSGRNSGLAHGVNASIASGCSRCVVILNNDVEVTPEWLEELVECAERHPHAGSIASKIRLFHDRTRLHSAGDSYSRRGVASNRGVWLEDTGQFDDESEIFAACGAAALYRRDALESVVLANGDVFDERLFMYYEDVDLAWRMQRGGYACVFAHRAVAYHRLSATGGGSLASYHVARNSLLVLRRSVPRQCLALKDSRILAHQLGRLADALPHLLEPAARATLRGAFAGVAGAFRDRSVVPRMPHSSRARITSLLQHDSWLQCRGVPVARLPRAPGEMSRTSTTQLRPEGFHSCE